MIEKVDLDLINKFRQIQNAPKDSRVQDNFDLYKNIYEHITINNNEHFMSINANIHFFEETTGNKISINNNPEFLDLYIDIKTIPVDEFDKFIFCEQDILTLIINHCKKTIGVEFKDLNGLLDKAYKSWENYLNRIGYDDKKLINVPEITYMKRALSNKGVVWCHNKSCSGKTYAAIKILKSNKKIAVFNPCFQSSCSYEFVKLFLAFGRDFTILIDDIQCDVEKAYELIANISNNIIKIKENNNKVFIVSWSSLFFDDRFAKIKNGIPDFSTSVEKCIALLTTKIRDEKLLKICGNNIALLNAASKINNDTIGDSETKLFNVFVHTNDEKKLQQIYKLSVLGIYEYAPSYSFLDGSIISSDDIHTLKIMDQKYYVGHREICNFIAGHIEKMAVSELPNRYDIIVEYIMSVDNNSKWKTIKQLIGETGSENLKAISPILNTLNCFEAELSMQTNKDPSWNNTPSSMYFVLKTAELLGVADEYKGVLSALCNNIVTSNNPPYISLKYNQLKTTNDFIQIKKRMINEDKSNLPSDYEEGENFSSDIAHKNWVLGLIVGLKDVLIKNGYQELYDRAIKELFLNQNEEGYWYPKRIPWITARILIGLSQAGYTINNIHMAKAIEYLLNILGDSSYWDAHTGGWNSIYETSSLCLEALIGSGFNCESNEKVQKVTTYLLSKTNNWTEKGNEIDGSATACELLKIVGIESDLLKYITALCDRCIYDSVHESENLNYDVLQSCNTTQIASYTVELCWYILERDLPSLLEDFINRSSFNKIDKEKGVNAMKEIFISYSEDSINHINRVRKISDKLKNEGYTVYFYADEPLGTNNIEFMQKIENCDIIIIIGTQKYKEKAMNIKDGGVFFEEMIISDVYMSNNYDKIIPIAFNDFSDSFPTPFNYNKGMRCKNITKKFLDNLVKEINKK